jgi:hypothetical protein
VIEWRYNTCFKHYNSTLDVYEISFRRFTNLKTAQRYFDWVWEWHNLKRKALEAYNSSDPSCTEI